MRHQRQKKDPVVSKGLADKLSKLVLMGYIPGGMVLVFTSFLYVPKGMFCICMVFDTTMIGLNDSLLYPNFMLPVIGRLIMMVVPDTHMVDIDVGEMFYNFRLSPVLTKYCEIDVGPYLGHKRDQKRAPQWMRWVYPIMGLILYPYDAIQGVL